MIRVLSVSGSCHDKGHKAGGKDVGKPENI